MRMIYQVAFSGPIQQAARTVRQSVSQSGWSVASRCELRTKHDRRGDYFWILNHRGASRPIIGCAFGLVCLRFCEVQAVVGFDSWIRDWSAPLFFAHVVVSRRRITQPMWKLIWPTILSEVFIFLSIPEWVFNWGWWVKIEFAHWFIFFCLAPLHWTFLGRRVSG